ncbi:MAG TPA: caspase family protein [Blastocatellia bacterium]|nr:caspase family protein [Blastocatellia bacterium]
MKKTVLLRNLLAVVAIASTISVSFATRTAAQELQERGLKARVGATKTELKNGAAKNVNLWAVLIGISRFKNGDQSVGGVEIQNLKSAADDAQAIYDYLRSDEGGGFADDHVLLLKDEGATKAAVEQALTKLQQSKPDDYFVLFIAAHGVLAPQFDTKLGRTIETPYFILYDTDPRQMATTGLPMRAFETAVQTIPARKGLVLTDTCHSAGVQLAGRGGEADKRANSQLIDQLKKSDAQGVGYLWAADQTEVSLEDPELNQGEGQGHGVFTYFLLEGMRGNADANVDGVVTFDELKKYVREKVASYTENKQNPGGNTTSIETNDIPVAIVPTDCKDPANCGSLVIRAPEMEGVNVAIDDKPAGVLTRRTEITRRVPTGDRLLAFTAGNARQVRRTSVQPGKSKFVEVNLTFTTSNDDALVPPPPTTDTVYFTDDKQPAKEAREDFLDGVDAFNRQEMDAAITKFNAAIKKNNGVYADAFVYRGRAEQSLGRKGDAVTSFQQALLQRKTDFETEAFLAEAKFNLDLDPAEVEPTLRGIIKRHPEWDFPYVVLGDVLLFRKDFIGAERLLTKAIRINPKSPPAHLILADVLTYQDSKEKRARAVEEAKEALNLFNEVSKKKVSAARALKGLSISHLIFGGGRFRNTSALAEAQHMVAKTIARKIYFTEDATDSDGQLAVALTAVNAARDYAKSDKARLPLVLETSALINFLKGDMARAIDDGEAALKLKELPEAHLTLTQAYASNQKFAPAVDHLTKYIALSRTQLSPDDMTRYQEELTRLTKMRDANRQKK